MARTAEPVVSPEELVARARALAPRLLERAERCERERRVPEESIQELKQAGLFRILQPRAMGGLEFDFTTYVRVAIELGKGCASTAWVYENNSMHQLILALFPAETQKELWGSGDPVRDARIASTGWSPRRTSARPVPGGYVLDGHWEFASGSWNCDLDVLLAPVERPGSAGGPPEMRLFLLDRAAGEYEIVDTWHAMGLRGTASNHIRVHEQFVPEHRTHKSMDGFLCNNPGNAVNTAPLYRMPFMQVFVRAVCTATLGACEGALNAYVILVGVQAVAIHANLGLDFGPLRYVLATPQFHHWHHSKDRQYMDANYAVHLPVIDVLFGTFRCPKGQWPAEYGIVSGEPPGTFWGQLLHPFRGRAR